MSQLPVFYSDGFIWKGAEGTTYMNTRFPDEFIIVSRRTHKALKFTSDRERNEANEFFDGEGKAYIAEGGVKAMIWYGEDPNIGPSDRCMQCGDLADYSKTHAQLCVKCDALRRSC